MLRFTISRGTFPTSPIRPPVSGTESMEMQALPSEEALSESSPLEGHVMAVGPMHDAPFPSSGSVPGGGRLHCSLNRFFQVDHLAIALVIEFLRLPVARTFLETRRRELGISMHVSMRRKMVS